MENTIETEMKSNDQRSLENSSTITYEETNTEDILIFEDEKPYKLMIPDIIY